MSGVNIIMTVKWEHQMDVIVSRVPQTVAQIAQMPFRARATLDCSTT